MTADNAPYDKCPGCRRPLGTEAERSLGWCLRCVGATPDEVKLWKLIWPDDPPDDNKSSVPPKWIRNNG